MTTTTTNFKSLPTYRQLEHRWAKHLDCSPYQVVACSSGTAALHLAWEALTSEECASYSSKNHIFPRSVALCDYGMLAGARSITMADLRPHLVSWNSNLILDTHKLRDKLRNGRITNPWAVLDICTYGHTSHCEASARVADQYDLYYIQDLAEAHGELPRPTADAACWSFYKNKIVAGEEGGAVYFKCARHADQARRLRCLGMNDSYTYEHTPRGYNYRLADRLAEPILESIDRWDENLKRRWDRYDKLNDQFPIETRLERPQHPWVYVLRLDGLSSLEMRDLVILLNLEGVIARCGFVPVGLQPEYKHLAYQNLEQNTYTSRQVYRTSTDIQGILYLPLLDHRSDEHDERYGNLVDNKEVWSTVRKLMEKS